VLPALAALLITAPVDVSGLAEAPLVVRGEVVARGGAGADAWTTVVVDSVLRGQAPSSALTFTGGGDLGPGDRVVLPLEIVRGEAQVAAGAAPLAVHGTPEIEAVEDAVRALPPLAPEHGHIAAAVAGALAFAGLLGVALRRS
jgi:hypothetical protein